MNSYQQPVDKCARNTKLRSRHAHVIHMLDWRAMLSCKSLSKAHRKRLRARACGVAIALVGAMSFGASPAESGSHDFTPKDYIRSIYSKEQALCLIKLYGKESAWDRNAIGNINGKIQSYGIPQLKNPLIAKLSSIEQVNYGVKYIKHRYETPCQAWEHWQKKGWH